MLYGGADEGGGVLGGDEAGADGGDGVGLGGGGDARGVGCGEFGGYGGVGLVGRGCLNKGGGLDRWIHVPLCVEYTGEGGVDGPLKSYGYHVSRSVPSICTNVCVPEEVFSERAAESVSRGINT